MGFPQTGLLKGLLQGLYRGSRIQKENGIRGGMLGRRLEDDNELDTCTEQLLR